MYFYYQKQLLMRNISKDSWNVVVYKEDRGLEGSVNQGEGESNMSELTPMMNLGREMADKLMSVGIESSEKLIEAGAKEAFLKLKQKYPNVCLVHLYALEGAIHGIEYNRLSEDTKKELKEFSDFLKK